ncbi:hypothetical protein EVAR_27690_1 [Eumeta japonica]|uniref:Uncharacterized protein n=1 Tax=Eumeta variegata TaxID=151549 RepID=A0A4C1WN00_EUMVA|nr:hypothetical protein EVAR_27690_1 [Eumeta japonica]
MPHGKVIVPVGCGRADSCDYLNYPAVEERLGAPVIVDSFNTSDTLLDVTICIYPKLSQSGTKLKVSRQIAQETATRRYVPAHRHYLRRAEHLKRLKSFRLTSRDSSHF